jgi:ribosomal protein S18 acetylase RimI-like enzyme
MENSASRDTHPDKFPDPMAAKEESSQSGIVVRAPTEVDKEALASHFLEMQTHYEAPVPYAVAARAAVLACRPVRELFDPRVLIAVDGNTILGSLVMNVTFPASELSMSLYIRDLYVAKAARRRGVGRMLVKVGTHLAVTEGFSAVEWTTDSTNKAARQLYESCGARQIDRTYFKERRGVDRPVAMERRRSRARPE